MEGDLSFPSLPAHQDHLQGEETVFYDTSEDRSSLVMVLLNGKEDSGTGSDTFQSCWASSTDGIGDESASDTPCSEKSENLGHDEGLEKGECPTRGCHVGEAACDNGNGPEKSEMEEIREKGGIEDEPGLAIEDIKSTNGPGLPSLTNDNASGIGELDAKLDLLLAAVTPSSPPNSKLAVNLEDARRSQERFDTTSLELRARLSEAGAASESLKKDLRGLQTIIGQNERNAQEERD
ncbi:hypothetical protein PM082_014626 [Marasmius tenuissimus]|nr:hypothetical protein PM082_014626 [Marasmius tenuissimus]